MAGRPQSPARQVPKGTASCSSFKGQRLYTITYQSPSTFVAVFEAKAGKNAQGLCQVRSPRFGQYLGGIALDPSGDLWAINSDTPYLMAFAPWANGEPTPLRTISGSNTLLVQFAFCCSQQIASDSAGNIWVPNWYDYNRSYVYVTAYANGANGNVAPIATIGYGDKGQSEGIAAPVAVAFDHEGNLYVAEYAYPGIVQIFSPPFSDTSKPVATWTLPDQMGVNDSAQYLAIDGKDNVYVGGQATVDLFKGGLLSGGVVSHQLRTPHNESVISGIAVDAQDRLYVATSTKTSIRVYDPGHLAWHHPVRLITSSVFPSFPASMVIGP